MIRHHLVGAAHLDRIGRTTSAAVLNQSNPGQFAEAPGGAALNVASSLRALCADVKLSSILGEDSAALKIAEAMDTRGVEISIQRSSDGAATASYTAILDGAGDLVIALADMDIYQSMTAGAVEIGPDDWLAFDANLPAATIEVISHCPSAHRAGLTVSAAKADRLRPVLGCLDVLFTNRAEAAALCGLSDGVPIADLANGLAALGIRKAVISDGASPVCVLDEGINSSVAVPWTDVYDVIGAGDALAAGCLFALSQGNSIVDAVEIGVKAARAILRVNGPYRADLAKAIGDI